MSLPSTSALFAPLESVSPLEARVHVVPLSAFFIPPALSCDQAFEPKASSRPQNAAKQVFFMISPLGNERPVYADQRTIGRSGSSLRSPGVFGKLSFSRIVIRVMPWRLPTRNSP